MSERRINGEGSVYQRRSDGLWVGAVTLGYDNTGRQRRKTVSAKTRSEALAKVRAVQRQVDESTTRSSVTGETVPACTVEVGRAERGARESGCDGEAEDRDLRREPRRSCQAVVVGEEGSTEVFGEHDVERVRCGHVVAVRPGRVYESCD
jgi:hypothetical protein